MTRDNILASHGTKGLLLAALVTIAIGCNVREVRAQDDGTEPPAATRPAPEAAPKKPKPKPRVRHAETPLATAVNDSVSDPRPVGARHICVIDRAAVDQQAAVNVASNKRLQDLRASAQAQVDDARKKVEAQLQSNDGELRQKPDDAVLKQRRQALAAQMQEIVNRAGLFSREYEATRQGVTNQLHSATLPIVQGVAAGNGCSVVLARETIVDPGDSFDISRPVVDKMNAQLEFKPFYFVDLSKK